MYGRDTKVATTGAIEVGNIEMLEVLSWELKKDAPQWVQEIKVRDRLGNVFLTGNFNRRTELLSNTKRIKVKIISTGGHSYSPMIKIIWRYQN